MKELSFSYDKKEYTLKYTLRTVQQMENAGFVLEELSAKPTVRIPELFYGAFVANHKGIKRSLVDEIYQNLNDKDRLVSALVDMYTEARDSLVDEGNVSWTVSE